MTKTDVRLRCGNCGRCYVEEPNFCEACGYGSFDRITMADGGETRQATLEHALEHHTNKLLSIALGVIVIGAGVATSTLVSIYLGIVPLALGIGQLTAYWRHDHLECDHPACADVEVEDVE